MLSRIIAIFTAPVDARSLRQYLRPRGPYDHLPDPFWDRLSRHPRRAILRYADWCRDRALLVDLDSLLRWEKAEAMERLEARRTLMNPKPLATVTDDRRVHRRRASDRMEGDL
ncbi:MAG: hypothetical protein KF861_02060 [Planctomycetaceae bacterium]|nr:hypothetical protein [Planctomycetaceae bacterium]